MEYLKKLKPCPFCGSNELLLSESFSTDQTVTWYRIHHGSESHCSISILQSDKESLLEMWNTRIEFQTPKNPLAQIEVTIYPDFEDFWLAYDKKVGKKSKIKKKFESLPQKVKEQIMEYLPNYIISQPDKRYRKNPETFLNNEGWCDELIMPERPMITVNRQTAETVKQNLKEVGADFIEDIRGNCG